MKKVRSGQQGNDNSFGIAGLIFGVLSIIFYSYDGIILGVLGIIFGLKQRNNYPNRWMLWAIALSIVGVTISLVTIMGGYTLDSSILPKPNSINP